MPNPTGTLYANFSQAISRNKNFKCKYCVLVCVCMYVCVIWLTSGFESFQKNPRSKTVGLNESRVWLGGHLLGTGICPVKCRTPVTSNICSSSVYSSPVFCEAQMESNRRFCLFSQFGGIVIDVSVVHWWQTWTDILIDSPWLLFERCSVKVKPLGFQFLLVGISEKISCISKYVFIEKSDKIN